MNSENVINSINEILEKFKEWGISRKEVSDGHHTFEELYYHRMILFSIICNNNKEIAWKSKLHDDGTMFDDDFIVGINTPKGQYTYHYDLKYWVMFDVKELDRAPKYDGHKPRDIYRLLFLINSDDNQQKIPSELYQEYAHNKMGKKG